MDNCNFIIEHFYLYFQAAIAEHKEEITFLSKYKKGYDDLYYGMYLNIFFHCVRFFDFFTRRTSCKLKTLDSFFSVCFKYSRTEHSLHKMVYSIQQNIFLRHVFLLF